MALLAVRLSKLVDLLTTYCECGQGALMVNNSGIVQMVEAAAAIPVTNTSLDGTTLATIHEDLVTLNASIQALIAKTP